MCVCVCNVALLGSMRAINTTILPANGRGSSKRAPSYRLKQLVVFSWQKNKKKLLKVRIDEKDEKDKQL